MILGLLAFDGTARALLDFFGGAHEGSSYDVLLAASRPLALTQIFDLDILLAQHHDRSEMTAIKLDAHRVRKGSAVSDLTAKQLGSLYFC